MSTRHPLIITRKNKINVVILALYAWGEVKEFGIGIHFFYLSFLILSHHKSCSLLRSSSLLSCKFLSFSKIKEDHGKDWRTSTLDFIDLIELWTKRNLDVFQDLRVDLVDLRLKEKKNWKESLSIEDHTSFTTSVEKESRVHMVKMWNSLGRSTSVWVVLNKIGSWSEDKALRWIIDVLEKRSLHSVITIPLSNLIWMFASPARLLLK